MVRLMGFTGIFAASALLLAASTTQAQTMEQQMRSMEKSVKTVEQRRREGLKDLSANVLAAYRDSISVTDVQASVDEVFEDTVTIKVVANYAVDFDKAQMVRETLSKYFTTVTDKSAGVTPYGSIYTQFGSCVAENCAIKSEAEKFLKGSAVGLQASFMGEWELMVFMQGNYGIYDIKKGQVTFLIDVPKNKVKGDPKPQVKAQIFDLNWCGSKGPCYSVR